MRVHYLQHQFCLRSTTFIFLTYNIDSVPNKGFFSPLLLLFVHDKRHNLAAARLMRSIFMQMRV